MTADRRWVPLLIVAFTAVFRMWMLDIKPPHFDEGINGWFVDQMMKSGYYEYDPSNYHGPLHFYILWFFKVLFGRNLWALRMPTVIVSTLTVWLVTKFDRFLDRRACWIAAAAMAVSPGMEFYGRYAIHEAELTFFLILAVWGMAGIWRFGGMQYLWCAMLGATGMVLTKETYIIHFVAFALAIPCLWVLEEVSPSTDELPLAKKIRYTGDQLWTVGAVCALLIIFFYSGNFLDFPLLKGLYKTYSEWISTGTKGKSGHEKPWYYWLKLIGAYWPGVSGPGLIQKAWERIKDLYEVPVIIGMLVSWACLLLKSNRLVRYLLIYGWGAFTAYSIVAYKTPWCIITIMWPFLFVFGYFFAKWMDYGAWKPVAILVLALVLGDSFYVSRRLSFERYTDENEDYVYVQTLPDLYKLTKPLMTLVRRDPVNYQLKGNIIMDSAYPLPWILGDFPHVDYYNDNDEMNQLLEKQDNLDAAFLVLDDREEDAQGKLKNDYFVETFHLRSAQEAVKLYLDYNTFRDFFPPDRKPDFVAQGVAVPADAPAPDSNDKANSGGGDDNQ